MRRAFTLIELLVVMVIILAISVIALPQIIPALSHRQVSEAARLLQGALVGARDQSLKDNIPSGIRLLPDPAFPLTYLPNGQLDPTQPLVASRIIPLGMAPEYSEGLVSRVDTAMLPNGFMPYPALMVCEQATGPNGLNNPTCWFWNVRLGDKIRFNEAGPWYTIVGPMVQGPAQSNSELFVNVGPPNMASPFSQIQIGVAVHPEFLWLVNGRDDNANGWIDEGYDGVDNNGNGIIDELAEWEPEAWTGANFRDGSPYTIKRRPAPLPNSREISLPTQVVIDLTTWGTTRERSRLPIDYRTGFVDLLVNPNGTVAFAGQYGVPSSVSMDADNVFFWLAERSDVRAPLVSVPALPIGDILPAVRSVPYAGPRLDGEFTIIQLAGHTGRLGVIPNPNFDNPASPIGLTYPVGQQIPFYQPRIPFAFDSR